MSTYAETIVYVLYGGTVADRFKRQYYTERHLPLVKAAWGRLGFQSVAAFWTTIDADGTVAICECHNGVMAD